MLKAAWISSPHLKELKTREWDVPMFAYTGAKLGVLATLAHHLHHYTADADVVEAFLSHSLIELVGYPCAGMVFAACVAALHNRFTMARRGAPNSAMPSLQLPPNTRQEKTCSDQ
jgi:hypothetical protein